MLPSGSVRTPERPTLSWSREEARWRWHAISSQPDARRRRSTRLRAADEAERASGFDEANGLIERVLPHVSDPHDRALLLYRMGRLRWLDGEPAAGEQLLSMRFGVWTSSGSQPRRRRLGFT